MEPIQLKLEKLNGGYLTFKYNKEKFYSLKKVIDERKYEKNILFS